MELEGVYALSEAIAECAHQDAAVFAPDPARGLFTKKEVENMRQDASWFITEVKGRMSLGPLSALWCVVMERRAVTPRMIPLWQFDEETERKCLRCGQKKREEEFPWIDSRGIVDGWCRQCRSEHAKEHNPLGV